MKVNEKYLSIPPYLSVRWCDVEFIKTVDKDLHIMLKANDWVIIPNLDEAQIESIFLFHSTYLEQEVELPEMPVIPMGNPMMGPFGFNPMMGMNDPMSALSGSMGPMNDMPVAFKIGTTDGVISAMGHNPAMSKSPILPPEMLDKFANITNVIGANEVEALPKPVQGCHCFFCQIVNRLHEEVETLRDNEFVSLDDLTFRDWVVEQTGDKLFSVENPLDSSDKYSVYLGHPMGCSCGLDGCEHIIAVLKS